MLVLEKNRRQLEVSLQGMPNKNILLIVGIVIGLAVIFFIGRGMLVNKLVPAPTTSPLMAHQAVYNDMVRLENPRPGQLVKSPLVVTGEARGNWYFEASFPVRIFDANGVELGLGIAQAEGEWMTTEYVPFTAILEFKKPATTTGTLVLHKDNPSGLPEFDAELRVPVSFDLANWPSESDSRGCKITGCSGQVCAPTDVVTTCEYRANYACYKTAKCERQEDGQCGWTLTEELLNCFQNTQEEI